MRHDFGRFDQADLLGVAPLEELLAVCTRILDATEALQEVGPVLQHLELRLRVRVVVRDVRPAVCFGDLQVDDQVGDGFGSHAAAAIGMQCQGTGRDILFCGGIGDDLLGELCIFARSEHPAHDVMTEDVEDHGQMEAGPFRRASRHHADVRRQFVGTRSSWLLVRVHRR